MAIPVGNAPLRNKVRRLAAIDIALLGYKLIFVEYAAGVVLALALGVFVLFRSQSALQTVWGAYLGCLGINYVAMLAYTIAIGSRENARLEMTDELTDMGRKRAMSKYRRISLLLLIPLAVPILAFAYERSKAKHIRA